MRRHETRMAEAERRIQGHQDLAALWLNWGTQIGQDVNSMKADIREDTQKTQRIWIAVARHLDLDLGDIVAEQE